MKIVIIGAGTSAINTADILIHDRNFKLVGFVGNEEDQKKYNNSNVYNNLPFLGTTDILKELINDGVFGFIAAIGKSYIREKRFYEASMSGLTPINAISKSAVIEQSAIIGKGVTIGSGCIISHGVSSGDNTCIDSGIIIEIKTQIGENCCLSSGTIVGGLCNIGRNVTLGSRSTISHNTTIGKNNIIASGKVVEKDISDKIRDEK